MRNIYLPYYISRAVIVVLFCLGTMGLTLQAGVWSLVIFGLMVFYLHSGWFSVDSSKPFFPLRRDGFALQVQRKALILSIGVSLLFNMVLKLYPEILSSLPFLDINILSLGIVLYFLTQFSLFLLGSTQSFLGNHHTE